MIKQLLLNSALVSYKELWRSWSVLYAKKKQKQNKSICLDPETFGLSG